MMTVSLFHQNRKCLNLLCQIKKQDYRERISFLRMKIRLLLRYRRLQLRLNRNLPLWKKRRKNFRWKKKWSNLPLWKRRRKSFRWKKKWSNLPLWKRRKKNFRWKKKWSNLPLWKRWRKSFRWKKKWSNLPLWKKRRKNFRWKKRSNLNRPL